MNYKERLAELNLKKQSYKSILEERNSRLLEIKSELETITKSQMVAQAVAKSVQSQLSSRIDNIVNLGLATCFPTYSFEMVYEPARGKTEVRFIVKDGDDVIDPMNQCGGGLVDVLCFCLRIAVYAISNVRDVIIFDEPFSYLSKAFREKANDLMLALSEKLGLQIIMVTHVSEFIENCSKRITIKKQDSVSCLI